MKEIKSLKLLTKTQEEKCDKIVSLLLELKKSGVHPIVVDGGGGSGLEFVRCSIDDKWDVGEEILNGNQIEVGEYIYTPNKTWDVPIDVLVP